MGASTRPIASTSTIAGSRCARSAGESCSVAAAAESPTRVYSKGERMDLADAVTCLYQREACETAA
jgi:hypothetical protein